MREIHIDTSPSETLKVALETIKKHDRYWKDEADKIYEHKLSLTDPRFTRINHLQQVFRFYLIPALESALKTSIWQQQRTLHYLPFFASEEKLNLFLKHFYSVGPQQENGWDFFDRDDFEQDKIILFDLLKIKRTIKGISLLMQEISNRNRSLSSAMPIPRQLQILKGFKSALMMTFKQSLKPEYQAKIYNQIHLDFFSVQEQAKRRREGIIHCQPNLVEGYPYRRIFLYILFRQNIHTIHKKKKITIHYNLFEFEDLIHEFFNDFEKIKADENLISAYWYIDLHKETFTEKIINDSDPKTLVGEEINKTDQLPSEPGEKKKVFDNEKDVVLIANNDSSATATIYNVLKESGAKKIFQTNSGDAALRMLQTKKINVVIYDENLHNPHWSSLRDRLPDLNIDLDNILLIITYRVTIHPEDQKKLTSRIPALFMNEPFNQERLSELLKK